MIEIAIGDDLTGYKVLEGASVAVPFKKATVNLTYGPEPILAEVLEITLSGTFSQIAGALSDLEEISLRSLAYAEGLYPAPVYLRFLRTSGFEYWYTPISNIRLATNPDGIKTHPKGSLLVYLHYTRPNYFDCIRSELPLTSKLDTNKYGGCRVRNHTGPGAGDGNWISINPDHFQTDLPTPLRMEFTYSTVAGHFSDLIIGSIRHPAAKPDTPYFANSADFAGGTLTADPTAIAGQYRARSWTATLWTSLFTHDIPLASLADFNFHAFQPILHLHNISTYNDLYLRFHLRQGADVMYLSDPVYVEPNSGYVQFPPITLPPREYLREFAPQTITAAIYGKKLSGATYYLDADQIFYFPVDYSVMFHGYSEVVATDVLVYSGRRERSNIRKFPANYEISNHVRQGGPLMLYPRQHQRFFFVMVTAPNRQIVIDRAASIRFFYRKRIRVL